MSGDASLDVADVIEVRERSENHRGRPRLDSVALHERVRHPHLDERLPGHTKTSGLLVDLTQQVNGEVHVDALNRTAGTDRLADVHVS